MKIGRRKREGGKERRKRKTNFAFLTEKKIIYTSTLYHVFYGGMTCEGNAYLPEGKEGEGKGGKREGEK